MGDVDTLLLKTAMSFSKPDTFRVAVVRFPGTNCDMDTFEAISRVSDLSPEIVGHLTSSLDSFDAIVVPGGFSYGDYLRTGAIAARTPVVKALRFYADNGGPVLGICNGFQILAEAGLLPGVLLENSGRRFICDDASLVVEQTDTPFTSLFSKGSKLTLPIAHQEGRFHLGEREIATLEENGQVVMRYRQNPNGSQHDIAAISNVSGNVVGMMPHPERRSSNEMGEPVGLILFASLLDSLLQASSPETSTNVR